MSPFPEIIGQDRKKPLCYDPKRDKFIYYDEIISGQEQIIPIEKLDQEQLKKLVIERNKAGPDYSIQVLSGAKYTRDQIIEEIQNDTDFGKTTIQAEAAYLSDLLRQFLEN
jgi:hypothetical protein